MNQNVQEMVAKNVKFTKMVIQGKSEIGEKSKGVLSPKELEIGNVSNGEVFDDLGFIIKMKSGLKGIGVNDEAKKGDDEKGEEGKF